MMRDVLNKASGAKVVPEGKLDFRHLISTRRACTDPLVHFPEPVPRHARSPLTPGSPCPSSPTDLDRRGGDRYLAPPWCARDLAFSLAWRAIPPSSSSGMKARQSEDSGDSQGRWGGGKIVAIVITTLDPGHDTTPPPRRTTITPYLKTSRTSRGWDTWELACQDRRAFHARILAARFAWNPETLRCQQDRL